MAREICRNYGKKLCWGMEGNMKHKKTPFIMRPLMITIIVVSVLIVCNLAYRASERAEMMAEQARLSEMARLQESRAYYEGRISHQAPTIIAGDAGVPGLPEIPADIQAELESTPRDLVVPDYAELVPADDIVIPAKPLWQENAVAAPRTQGKGARGQGKIVIIIDDMGMDRKHTKEAMTLPAPVTFAWLPYAPHIQPLVDQAKASGHEAIVHVPMEPERASIDAGPTVLKTSMSADELKAMLDKNLSAFTGYVGFNNHMGSKMTQDADGMQRVMAEAARRGLLFVDSRTAPDSIAGQTAAAMGVAHASRDVFLDHYEDLNSVRAALQKMEDIARRQGVAIGIGHPKANTLAGLREWIPTLSAKGFEVVPVSAVVRTVETAAGAAEKPIKAARVYRADQISSPFIVGPLKPAE